MWNRIVWLLAPAALFSVLICAQDADAPKTPAHPRPQFFAGTVTELDSAHITVSRSVLGRSPEQRTFLIESTTKMSNDLRTKERVTVRYRSDPDGDVALEILVRTRRRAPHPS
jgi:hypothetical protein